MKKSDYIWWRLLMAATFVAIIVVSGCLAPPRSTGSGDGSAAISGPGGAPQEGIKVHGRWTIEVTNPDGTVADRREFDNALMSYGAQTLAKVLGRQNAAGGWVVTLSTAAVADSAFMDAAGSPFVGLIRESSDMNTWPYLFKTLTIDVPTSGANQDKLVLSGTATAQRNGRIERVATSLSRLDAAQSPASSYAGTIWSFTGTTLAAPVNLTAGQQVAVTVVISFS